MNKIKLFRSIKFKGKVLIVRVIFLTAIARFAMLKLPFKKLKKYMGQINEESSFKIDGNFGKDFAEDFGENEKGNCTKSGKGNQRDLNYVINDLKRFRWAIQAVSKRTPWESKCLVQALTAQYLSNKKGITTTLYLGVKRDSDNNLIAHSWIRCGDFYITGGNGAGYAITAKFTKDGNKINPVG
ncbi:MAG: lasso peptide biosynthesis B2 protein [Clostridium sp.]